MRKLWNVGLVLLTGCEMLQTTPREPATQQVASNPFTEPRRGLAPRVDVQPATKETADRVELLRSKLVGENSQVGLRPNVISLNAVDPEIFHTDTNNIYITEGLVKQCQTDGQLAAVLAYEMGRMVAERDAAVSDQAYAPQRLPPIHLSIAGSGNSADADPLYAAEMARFEQQYPRNKKRIPVNPQLVARSILDHAGFQRTEFDAALPILQNAERYSVLETQFKGTGKQSEWK